MTSVTWQLGVETLQQRLSRRLGRTFVWEWFRAIAAGRAEELLRAQFLEGGARGRGGEGKGEGEQEQESHVIVDLMKEM